MRYTTIIFDMDGTIVQTEHLWQQATHELIKRRGITLSADDQITLENALHGLSIHESCRFIKDLCRLPDPLETLIQEKGARAQELYADGIRFIEGFIDFHRHASSRGIKTAIGTNARQHIVDITDKKLNLKQFFGNHLYCMEHVAHKGKPDPAIFLHAAQKLNAAPQECIVIEDSPHGIRAAKSAGMYCIAINTSRKIEKLHEADRIIQSYHELDLDNLR